MKKGLKQKGDTCIICNQKLGEFTAAIVSHLRKHVRDGSLEESKNKDGKLIWKTTGNEPKEKEPPTYWRSIHKPTKVDPRLPAAAKSDKKGKILIRCRKCQKWSKSVQDFADGRFISISCCDNVTLFPKRMIGVVIKNPGREYIE